MAPRSVCYSVRSRKLSNVGQSLVTKNLLSRAPPCFGWHAKPLVSAAFAVVSTHQSALGSRGELWPVLLGGIIRLMMMMMIHINLPRESLSL
jgi:hypothetical protein